MVQGMFAGGTSYEDQSLENIYDDIKNWIEYTRETETVLLSNKSAVKNSEFWNKIEYNFRTIIDKAIRYCSVIIYDLELVKDAIERNCITKKEVLLLKKIGKNSIELQNEYSKAYHYDESWHEYGNADFEKVERIYEDGGVLFSTLWDADNAATRLGDYMGNGQIINNSLNIHGNVSSSQVQQGTSNSTQTLDISNSFDYDRVLEALNEIKRLISNEEFNVDFVDKSPKVSQIVEETIKMVENKKEPNEIKEHLNTLKELVIGVSGSVLANSIYALITNLPIW
jgi:hypothetical protein